MAEVYIDEKTLITALHNGEEAAMESLFRSHYEGMCSYANTFLNDIDESEEVVQQLFVQLWEKRASLKITNSIQSYLYRAVRNTSLNKIKHGKVRQLYAEEISSMVQQSEPSSSITLQKELQEQINKAIDGLPEQCKLIFKMSRFEELKYAEIATQLGLSIKTIENQMGKALRIMREKLKDYLVIFIILALDYI